MEFTKTVWLDDAYTSLKNLLKDEVVANEFMSFLKKEVREEGKLDEHHRPPSPPNTRRHQALPPSIRRLWLPPPRRSL